MRSFIILAACSVLTASAFAQTPVALDFEVDGAGNALQTGQIIDNEFQMLGLSISAFSAYGPNKAIIFDSANPTGGDGDLRSPGYGVGNNSALGKILIIAENTKDRNNDGLVDNPDDQARGGYIDFKYDSIFTGGSVDLLDIEEKGGTIQLYNGNSLVDTIAMSALGDNSWQTVSFNGSSYDRIRVNFAGSGAVTAVNAVPEPGTMLALAAGIGAMAAARRRRRKTA